MIAVPGAWRNFEELEEALSLPELLQILDSFRELEMQRFKAQASLKGIDLDKDAADEKKSSFDEIKRRAEAKLRGISEEELEFTEIGIKVEEF